ncbi:MAG TPA: hypothetical protein VHD87_12850 [Acidimicrobiales bacterium]|nr:hypothetical protein [Acidimicrobiales bacterium]
MTDSLDLFVNVRVRVSGTTTVADAERAVTDALGHLDPPANGARLAIESVHHIDDLELVGADFARQLDRHEVANGYVGPEDRFVVSMTYGVCPEEDAEVGILIETPEDALARCLDFIIESDGAYQNNWGVYDRATGTMYGLRQGDGAELRYLDDDAD